MATQKQSEFYFACRNGVIETVETILPNLKVKDINRIEPNGSTALHAASYYGHADIVCLLLEHGADATIRNKYDKTAKEEASNNEVRAAFKSIVKLENVDDNDDMPTSKRIQIYQNLDHMNKSTLATRSFKARLGTYDIHKYSISAESNLEHLRKMYRQRCEEKRATSSLELGERHFNEYEKTGNFDHMIMLYTSETPFYNMIHGDEAFTVEMYKHAYRYEKYNFQGRTYGPLRLDSEDLQVYQWSLAHPKSFVEIRQLIESYQTLNVAFQFLNHLPSKHKRVLLEIDFPKPCFTALDVQSLSACSSEQIVLVLSGTFFEVRKIQEDDRGFTIISLQNISVDKSVLSSII